MINISNDHSTNGAFQGQRNQMMKQIMQMNITWVKIPNWREADQLTIYMYKYDQVVELGSTEKQIQLSGQSGT